MRLAGLLLCVAAAAACDSGPVEAPAGSPVRPTPGLSSITVGPGQAFTRIQEAVDAAAPGATITVLAGTYAERVAIARPLELHGRQAVLDGLAGGLDGRFVGIEVTASNVEITGFIVRNFERGLVLDRVTHCRISGNEIHHNTSKDPPPISAGVTKSDGIVLIEVQDSEVSENFVHHNGSIGLFLSRSSGGNLVRGNRFVDNGTQQGLPGSGFSGGGIVTGVGNNTRNQIIANQVSGSYWGIRIGSGPDSANLVRDNRIERSYRAGIGVWGQHNRIENNEVTASGSANLPPSCRHDLFDQDVIDNDWIGNSGTLVAGPASNLRPCP